MIFKDIEIHSFGKISNLKLSFTDSLNVIYGPNESGKSTISAFLEAMLYSYPARDTERKKYIPWDKDFSSGSITLENNGECITVFRKITPIPSRDVLEVVPERRLDFIPSDRETYRKTVYSGEGKSSDFGRTDEIEQKIANIMAAGDENINASAAIERLEAFRKTIKPKKGNGGRLGEALNKISLLETELHRAKAEEELCENCEKELSRLNYELDILKEERNLLLSEPDFNVSDSSDEKIAALNGLIQSLPSDSSNLPKIKFPIWVRLLYIICTAAFIIPALLVSKWFFVPLCVILLFGTGHFILAKRSYLKALGAFLKEYGCSSKEDYFQKLNERELALEQLKELLKNKDIDSAKEYDEQIQRKEKIDLLNNKIVSLVDKIVSLKSKTSTSLRNTQEILSELEYYKNLHLSLTQKLSAIDSAIEAISYAKDNISKNVTPQVSKRAMEYLNLIAPKESRNITLKEDLSLYLTDPMPQNISSCSFGFKEELHLCFRIALSEFLYGKNMPLIFDDPFLGSDDYREKALIDLFNHISRDRQIIIFTNRQNPYYNQIGCNFIDITG